MRVTNFIILCNFKRRNRVPEYTNKIGVNRTKTTHPIIVSSILQLYASEYIGKDLS